MSSTESRDVVMAPSFEFTMDVTSEGWDRDSTSWIGSGMKDCAAAWKVGFMSEEVNVSNKSASFLKGSDTSPFLIWYEYFFAVWKRQTI